MGLTSLRVIAVAGLIALIALAIVSRRPGNAIWHWQATLLGTEFGHFMALLALALGGAFFWVWPSMRWWGFGASVVLAALFLEPLWRAIRIEGRISVGRMFLPAIGPDTSGVTLRRERFTEAEEPPLEALILRPATKASSEPLPWVLSVHGGGWNGGRPDEFLAWDRELASRGFVVILPEYRLAPEHQWPAPREDLRTAAKWARKNASQLGFDPENLTIMGRSAGGQIGSAAAFGDPELKAKRCIAFYAPHDLFFAWKHARPDDTLDSVSLLREYLGGRPEGREEIYRSGSPIRLIDENTPPTLLIHGTRDTLVWVKQSRRLATQIEQEDGQFEFLELPWATHACDYFPSSPGGQVTMEATVRFLREMQ